jgi:hypothetical protein
MLRQAIKETLLDESVVSSLQHLVYGKLSGLSKKRREAVDFDKGVKPFAFPDPSQETSGEPPIQQQKKRRNK